MSDLEQELLTAISNSADPAAVPRLLKVLACLLKAVGNWGPGRPLGPMNW
jgi:hypothetical protein